MLRRYRRAPCGDATTLAWRLFLPALNEEWVVGGTIDYLRATFPRAHVWVIDDDSEDNTAAILGLRAWADPIVHLVRRYGLILPRGVLSCLIAGFLPHSRRSHGLRQDEA